MADTSPAQDVQALVTALYTTIRAPEFDDMPFPEVARAFDLALHKIRTDFMVYGRIPAEPFVPSADSPLASGR